MGVLPGIRTRYYRLGSIGPVLTASAMLDLLRLRDISPDICPASGKVFGEWGNLSLGVTGRGGQCKRMIGLFILKEAGLVK
jgi:hypothetical protein